MSLKLVAARVDKHRFIEIVALFLLIITTIGSIMTKRHWLYVVAAVLIIVLPLKVLIAMAIIAILGVICALFSAGVTALFYRYDKGAFKGFWKFYKGVWFK